MHTDAYWLCHRCLIVRALISLMHGCLLAVLTATSIADHQFFQDDNKTDEEKFKWGPHDDVSWHTYCKGVVYRLFDVGF